MCCKIKGFLLCEQAPQLYHMLKQLQINNLKMKKLLSCAFLIHVMFENEQKLLHLNRYKEIKND